MMNKHFGFGVGALLALLLSAGAAIASTPYLVEAKGDFPAELGRKVAAAGGTLIRVQPEIGVAEAISDNPGFAAALAAEEGIQAVTRDRLVQWIPTPAAMTSERLSGPAAAPKAARAATASSTRPRAAGNERATTEAAPAAALAAEIDPTKSFFFACQWHLGQIAAPAAWARGALGSPKLAVAVLDTGVDPTHVDLDGRVDTAASASLLTPGSSPCGADDESSAADRFSHGTFVASLIAGNGVGVAGVAPRASIVAVKVLNCSGSGSFGDLVAGIHYAATLPQVDVINLSLGALLSRLQDGRLAAAVAKAVAFAHAQGKLVVAPEGNNGIDLDRYGDMIAVPAESGALAVYATAIDQRLATYSNRGHKNSVGAPGGDLPNPAAPLLGCAARQQIQSLMLGACSSLVCGATNRYILAAGTAFAAPLVAGLANLIDAAAGGGTSPEALESILNRTAEPIQSSAGDAQLRRRVNAAAALANP